MNDEKISVQGRYLGKNLYVQIPGASGDAGFCVDEVRVNGQVTDLKASIFEIDLKAHGLRVEDKVEIVLRHKPGCKPEVLNPEALQPKSTFKMTIMYTRPYGNDLFLEWETTGESGILPYTIQLLRWGKWVNIGEVQGTGKAGPNTYKFKPQVVHSGNNILRVSQTDYTGEPRLSAEHAYSSAVPSVSFSPKNPKTTISFSAITTYEVWDAISNKLLLQGTANSIDVSRLPLGSYDLYYDNKQGTFAKY